MKMNKDCASNAFVTSTGALNTNNESHHLALTKHIVKSLRLDWRVLRFSNITSSADFLNVLPAVFPVNDRIQITELQLGERGTSHMTLTPLMVFVMCCRRLYAAV